MFYLILLKPNAMSILKFISRFAAIVSFLFSLIAFDVKVQGIAIFLIIMGALLWWLPSKVKRGDFALVKKQIQQQDIRHTNGQSVLVSAQLTSRKMYQALETTYILCNSVSLKTVKERLAFLKDLLPSLVNAYGYDSIKQLTIDKYNADYYDRPVTQEQINIIDDTGTILNNWNRFNDDCLFACFKRYADRQLQNLHELKTHKGRSNRKNLIVEMGDDLYNSLFDEDARQKLNSLLYELKKLDV